MSFEDVAIPEGSTSLFVGAQSGNIALVRHALATDAGATLPQDVPRFYNLYLERIRELGSFPAYEKAHRQSFVALLAPKFPRLPVDALSHVVSFWAHVGDY